MVRSASSRVSNHGGEGKDSSEPEATLAALSSTRPLLDPSLPLAGLKWMGSHRVIKYHARDRDSGEPKMKSGFLAAVAAGGLLLASPASAQGVKIGILNDQSGVYADYGGKYSVEAARMAIEDFGGSVLGQKIEMVNADHQ